MAAESFITERSRTLGGAINRRRVYLSYETNKSSLEAKKEREREREKFLTHSRFSQGLALSFRLTGS